MSSWLKGWSKGGPGSGRRPGGSGHYKPSREGRDVALDPRTDPNAIRKPAGYTERPSSNIPRSGVRPQDLYPERYNADGTRKPKKHWLGAWLKRTLT